MQSMLRRFWAPTMVIVALALSLIGFGATAASAFDGRVPDGRAANPTSEIEAYYWHGLNRDIDTAGRNSYFPHANQDCRWGVQSAGASILASGEMQNRWRSTSDKVGALYASLFNRAPDSGGLNTYVNAINSRGLMWSITAMQSSGEFRSRLDRICSGRASTNATVWNAADAVGQAAIIHDGTDRLVLACGVGFLADKFGKVALLKDYKKVSIIIKADTALAKRAAEVGGGSCNAAYELLRGADRIASIAGYEGSNSPVFLQSDTRSWWNAIGKWCQTNIRTGPNATQWNLYTADYRC